jgi:hypothetical protein
MGTSGPLAWFCEDAGSKAHERGSRPQAILSPAHGTRIGTSYRRCGRCRCAVRVSALDRAEVALGLGLTHQAQRPRLASMNRQLATVLLALLDTDITAADFCSRTPAETNDFRDHIGSTPQSAGPVEMQRRRERAYKEAAPIVRPNDLERTH